MVDSTAPESDETTRVASRWEGEWQRRWPLGQVRTLRLTPLAATGVVTGRYTAQLDGDELRVGHFSLFVAEEQPVLDLAGLGLFVIRDGAAQPDGRLTRFGLQRWSPTRGPHGLTVRMTRRAPPPSAA